MVSAHGTGAESRGIGALMATRSSHCWLRLPAAGIAAVAIVMAPIIVLMSWSPMQPRAAAAASMAERGKPPQLTEAQAAAPKRSPQAQAPKPAQIDRNGVLILIRTTLLALDQANKTGNYTVLRDLGSPEFQVNTAARLAEIFVNQRKDNLDLSGVAVLDPQLTMLPQIEANGMMHMAGFFPSVPTQVNFELLYAPVNRQWRLFGVSVSLGQAAPVAPPAPEPPPAALPKAEVPQAHAPKLRRPKTTNAAHATPPSAAAKTADDAKQ